MATKKKTTKTTTIPRVKTEAEEAAWWDAHPDFLAEQFEIAAKKGRLQRGIPKSKSVTIRVPVRDLETAQRLAERKGLPYQTYMKMLASPGPGKRAIGGMRRTTCGIAGVAAIAACLAPEGGARSC